MSIRTLAKKLGDSNPVAHQFYSIAHNKVREEINNEEYK